jgi:hypothetical protein
MTIEEHFAHLEQEAALREAKDAAAGQAQQSESLRLVGLRDRLIIMRAEARTAAMRFDEANELLRLLDKNPQMARILELAGKLGVV